MVVKRGAGEGDRNSAQRSIHRSEGKLERVRQVMRATYAMRFSQLDYAKMIKQVVAAIYSAMKNASLRPMERFLFCRSTRVTNVMKLPVALRAGSYPGP